MAIHVVYVTTMPVVDGVVLYKDTATIKEMLEADTEMRVIPHDDIPNSSDSPTIETYLERENSDGYSVGSISNTMIVTES